MGVYVRSWYMLGTEELLFSPNPNLHISILEARDLEVKPKTLNPKPQRSLNLNPKR